MSLPIFQPVTTDPAECFATLLQMGGNVARCAAALQMDEGQLQTMADTHGWGAKIKSYGAAADATEKEQRLVNRAINYLLAHRLRAAIDGIVTENLSTPAKTRKFITKTDRHGNEFVDTKPLRELTDAARIATEMSYRSLGDSMDQTVKDGQRDPRKAAADMHLSVTKAMQLVDENPNLNAVEIIKGQIGYREAVVASERTGEKRPPDRLVPGAS
jgi:hypothetical protein